MGAGAIRALFFSDIEGSTVLLQRLGGGYVALLVRHQEIVRAGLQLWGGVEHSTEGDSFFATFVDPVAAVGAARQIQLDHQREPWPEASAIRVRIGVHLGDVEETAAGLVGLAIHHAARIAVAGHGGQIVVSEAARDARFDDSRFEDLGNHRLVTLV